MKNINIFIFILLITTNIFAEPTECQDIVDKNESIRSQNIFDSFYKKRLEIDDYKKLADKINKTSFVFTTGFMSNFQAVSGAKNFDGIINDMKRLCQLLGCHFDYRHSYDFGMNTVKPSEDNAIIVERMIKDIQQNSPDKEILLVGHSKGGLDITHAMLNMVKRHEDTQKLKVLTFSTPYYGSPIATQLLSNRLLKMISEKLLSIFYILDNFNSKKIRGTTTTEPKSQKNYLASLQDLDVENNMMNKFSCRDLKAISSNYISFASSYDNKEPHILKKNCMNPYNLILLPFKLFLDRLTKNTNNDGMVTKEAQKGIGRIIDFSEPLTHTSMVMKEDAIQPSQTQIKVFLSLLNLF